MILYGLFEIQSLQTQIETSRKVQEQFADVFDNLNNVDIKFTSKNDQLIRVLEQQKELIKRNFSQLKTEISTVNDQTRKELAQVVENAVDDIKQSQSRDLESIRNEIQMLHDELEKVENRMNTVEVTTTGKLNDMQARCTDMQSNLENFSQMIKTQIDNVVKTNQEFKQSVTKQVESLNEKLQTFRFETDKALATKADVIDMQRKVNKSDFESFQNKMMGVEQTQQSLVKSVENITSQFNNIDDKLSNNLVSINKKFDEIKDESDEFNGNLKSIQTEMRQRCYELSEKCNDMSKNASNDSNITDIIEEMSNQINDLRSVVQPPIASHSKNGACFSCGRSFPESGKARESINANNSLPALSPVHKSPDQSHYGGGYNRLPHNNAPNDDGNKISIALPPLTSPSNIELVKKTLNLQSPDSEQS